MIRTLFFHPCFFLKYVGLYCPGCGGTRAVIELLHGHLLRSLWYHPIVLYAALVIGWYGTSRILSQIRIRKGKKEGRRDPYQVFLQYRNRMLGLGAFIVIVNWLIRNILLVCFGVTL